MLRLFLSLAAPALGAWSWHQTLSPHFAIFHQSPWMPPGFVTAIEKMHGRLRMDLAMFSPWMAKERLNLYLYQKRESYSAGEFQPPAWSNGVALYDRKIVAVYDHQDRDKLRETISHETTHLLFESYWSEEAAAPPSWLNEGLAMMEEAESAAAPERSGWYQSMAFMAPDSILPFKEFIAITPTEDLQDKNKVSSWYVQAYAIVYFLYREHSRLQFKNFCARLREGQELEKSLWLAYRYARLADFEKAWRNWLKNPVHRRRVEKALRARPALDAPPEFKPIKSFNSPR